MLSLNGHRIDTDRAVGRALLHDGTDRDASTSITTTSIEVPGRHGAIRSGLPGVHQSRPLRLHWEITGPTRTVTEQRLDALLALLVMPSLTLARTRSGIEQVIDCELVSVAAPTWALSGRSVRVAVVLQLTAPFWTDATTKNQTVSAGTSVECPQFAGSTAPLTDLVIRLAATTTAATITDPASGTGVIWASDSGTGWIFIRPRDMRAWRASGSAAYEPTGTDASANLDRPGPGPLVLTPTYTATGTKVLVSIADVTSNVAIRARRSYL